MARSKYRPLFLSVDWDFFVPEDELWDWGHQENGLFIEAMWQFRLADFFAKGKDLRKEMALATCDPGAKEFWRTMERLGYKITKQTEVTVGESHAQAAGPFIHAAGGKPIDVLHFDAHADSGYGKPDEVVKRVRAALQKGQTDCGSWLLALAMSVPTNVTYVYPKWKGLKEWAQFEGDKDARLKEFSDYQAVVYDEDDMVEACPPRPVSHVFICRSGAWTPPWLDEEFFLFSGEPLGRTMRMFKTPAGPIDPLVPRKLDVEGARKQSEQIKEMMRGLAGAKK